MAEQFANEKNIRPGLCFENLEPQIAEQFANKNMPRKKIRQRSRFVQLASGYFFFNWQIAKGFAVQDLKMVQYFSDLGMNS